MLIGRDAELAHLAATLDAARLGTTTALVIEGEPGVGKTTLLEATATAALDPAIGARVFVTAGDELSSRPYGVISDLVASGAALHRLDAAHRSAIDAAAGLGGITSTAAIAGAFVALLAETAAEAPTVLLVDDLHWIDGASVELLRYAFDRLEADRLALVATVRTDTTNPLAGLAKAETLALAPLAASDATALLHSTALPLTDDVVARLVDGAGGNPLALFTAARLLTASQRTGAAPLPDPLTAGPRLTSAFGTSIDALPASTQVALVVVAAAGTVPKDTLTHALTDCGLSTLDLQAAVDDELLTDALAFRHPLIRAAAYHGAPRPVRTQAHRALAAAARASGDEIGLASHLLAIADVPDDDAAAAALRAAQLLFERGLPNQAGAMAREASRLFADEQQQHEAALAALGFFMVGGGLTDVVDIANGIIASDRTGVFAAPAIFMRGGSQPWTVGPAETAEVLEASGAEAVDTDAPIASQYVIMAGLYRLWTARNDLMARNADAMVALGPERLGPAFPPALLMQGMAAQFAARTGDAETGLAIGRQLATMVVDDPPDPSPKPEHNPWIVTGYVGLTALTREDHTFAERVFSEVTRVERERMLVLYHNDSVVWQAELLWRTGRWTDAVQALMWGVENAAFADQALSAWPRACLARIQAGRGNREDAERKAALALEFARTKQFHLIAVWAWHALALDRLAVGEYEDALGFTTQIADRMDASHITHPSFLWWEGEHIEALIRCGHVDESRRRLDDLVARSMRCNVVVPRAQALRCELLLRDQSGAAPAVAEAIELLDSLDIDAPFERARVHLVAAERLKSREHAAKAADIFARLGAARWLERAQALGDVRASHPVAAELTEAELRVALVIGKGLTNKEAASELYLSVKTVEYHLSNIYKKLDIRTRAQLARVVVGLG